MMPWHPYALLWSLWLHELYIWSSPKTMISQRRYDTSDRKNRPTAFDMTIACLPPALVCSWWLISLPFWICPLTHWGRLTQICVSKLTTIGSDNGRRQANIWTNDGMLLIRTSRTNFNKILSDIRAFRSRKCIGICHLWYGSNFASASMC